MTALIPFAVGIGCGMAVIAAGLLALGFPWQLPVGRPNTGHHVYYSWWDDYALKARRLVLSMLRARLLRTPRPDPDGPAPAIPAPGAGSPDTALLQPRGENPYPDAIAPQAAIDSLPFVPGYYQQYEQGAGWMA